MSDSHPSFQRDETPAPLLLPRGPESHKGTFGTALLVGGSREMSGAISLAGMSALRGGAGLVRLAVPDVALTSIAAHEPSYMTAALESDAAGRIAGGEAVHRRLIELSESATALAVGPGLGRSAELSALVVALYGELTQPAVFDADALNALAEQPQVLAQHAGPRIVTPHPGEFSRLVALDTPTVQGRREELAAALARDNACIVVLKGHRTFVTDGVRGWTNSTGNPGMATGGTGDVLTGLITALLCQELSPYDAARLGVYLHGLAGDLAAKELGEVSLIASDLVRHLSRAFLRHTG
ncbi:MAG: NAD(P)H-hydrate dehydratase [Pirellulales bacterium]|nr:NAD(P)H-hydrate dehydratase [Pirellulales bacterium]